MTHCSTRPIMIMAGGTGGHIYPALAVARALKDQGVSVVWFGTQQGLEARIVPEQGIPMQWLSIQGLRGKGKLALLLAPFNLLRACIQAARVLRTVRPSAVLGMGGFVSGPGGLMARLMGVPLVIHEQNAIAGLTNKLLARVANRTLSAFPVSFKSACVGNPIRAAIAQVGQQARSMTDGRLNVLVLGGSLGALALNKATPAAFALLDNQSAIMLWHQTGGKHIETTLAEYEAHGIKTAAHKIVPYIDSMEDAYAWADVVVCRAGAMTVSELAATGSASILVPYPYAVDDHQTANAQYLATQGAAYLKQQSELTPEWLASTLTALLNDKHTLQNMQTAALALAKPRATQSVVDALLEVSV